MTQLWAVLRKDLLIEWRSRAHGVALVSFAITLLLLFSFAVGPNANVLRAHASAYLWMGLVLTSSLQLARSFQVETESNALDTLVLAPVSPPALFYGKALSNTLQLFGVGLVSLPAVIALYDVEVKEPAGLLLLTLILGALGLAAPGTLYAGLTARLAARQLMLPLLLFPLVVPCLLAAVKATTLILQGDPMDQIGSWLTLLACFDALYWSLCGVLFGKVIDA